MNPDGKSTIRSAGGLLGVYRRSHYRVRLGRCWHRLHVGAGAPGLQRALPRASDFAVITAFNPHSQARDARSNRRDLARLAASLRAAGVRTAPGYNAGPGGEWPEPSLLAVGARAPFIARLAARHGQLAVLVWRRGEPVALCKLSRDGRGLEPVPV